MSDHGPIDKMRNQNIRKLIVVGLCTMLISTGCSNNRNTEALPETNNENTKTLPEIHLPAKVNKGFNPTIPLSEVNNLSDIEIVEKLFPMYLEHFKSESIPDDKRVKNYKDIRVRNEKDAVRGKEAENYNLFSVGYSVQSYRKEKSSWHVANGQHKDDGWIIHKFLYVRLIKEEEQYTLERIGTGL